MLYTIQQELKWLELAELAGPLLYLINFLGSQKLNFYLCELFFSVICLI